MLIFLTNISLLKFLLGYLTLFHLLTDGFEWLWIGSLHKNIQLMLLRCWGWLSLLRWIGALTLSLAKTATKKIEALICSMKFLSSGLLCVSIILTFSHAWIPIVMSGLAFGVTTWNCQITCKNRYVGLLILHLLPLSNHWLCLSRIIIKTQSVFSKSITSVDVPRNWLNWFSFLIVEGGLLVILIDCMIFLSLLQDISDTARLWNSLAIECFPLTCDLNDFNLEV